MDLFNPEWLNLALRWIHLIVGIAWIGSSFYFVWQDDSLEAAPEDPERKTLQGDIWMVHGGGFYHVRKYKVAPPSLPAHLHWFKWESYATWISGFSLLVVLYWFGASAYLVPQGSAMTPAQAVLLSAGTLAGSWIVYDLLCRSLGNKPKLLAVVGVLLGCGLAYTLCQLFPGRAAFLHMGAALGTIMAANVFMVIIPNQRRMIDQMLAGKTPDPVFGKRGKTRSVHNTYLTLPVLFLMISNHYPAAYGHQWNWAILLALAVIGALVRRVFVLRHTGAAKPWMLPAAGAGFLILAITVTGARLPAAAPETSSDTPSMAPIALAIIQTRCTGCHSEQPTQPGFAAPPQGVVLSSAQALNQWRAKIDEQAVRTTAMPLGNVTGMTAEERAILGRWVKEAP